MNVYIIYKNGQYLIFPDTDEDIDRMNCIILMKYQSGTIETLFTYNNDRSVIPVFYSLEEAERFVDLITSKFARLAYIKSIDFLIDQLELETAKMIYEYIIRKSKEYKPPTQT